jgi:hypothetical protein
MLLLVAPTIYKPQGLFRECNTLSHQICRVGNLSNPGTVHGPLSASKSEVSRSVHVFTSARTDKKELDQIKSGQWDSRSVILLVTTNVLYPTPLPRSPIFLPRRYDKWPAAEKMRGQQLRGPQRRKKRPCSIPISSISRTLLTEGFVVLMHNVICIYAHGRRHYHIVGFWQELSAVYSCLLQTKESK